LEGDFSAGGNADVEVKPVEPENVIPLEPTSMLGKKPL